MKAALALIRCERDLAFLRAAISTLRAHGHRDFANVTILDERIEGWVAWDTGSLLEISITDGVDDFTTTAEPQPSYPLGGDLRVAHFSVRRPRSAEPQSIVLAVDGREIHRTSAAANEREPEEPRRAPIGVKSRAMATVIVPVYGDHEATRLCLDSLRNEIRRSGYRATIVNDATPDSRIAKLLAQLGKERYFDVLTNACNCGFVASVNRALRLADDGDVLILNSDTVLPPGCIGRLAAIAQSSADIGTVTPLSNNGEFTSFPRPNIANPLPSRREIERLDRIAAKANAGRVIDIPSGIGFCLYVTRACLDAVGSLSEDFGHGYLEDTDFCLRARSQGFQERVRAFRLCRPCGFEIVWRGQAIARRPQLESDRAAFSRSPFGMCGFRRGRPVAARTRSDRACGANDPRPEIVCYRRRRDCHRRLGAGAKNCATRKDGSYSRSSPRDRRHDCRGHERVGRAAAIARFQALVGQRA